MPQDGKATPGKPAPEERWVTDLADRLELRPDHRVLEVACGDGKTTATLSSYVPFGLAVGIDSASDLVAFARKIFGGLPNIEFHQMAAEDFAFPLPFDIVFTRSVLDGIRDHGPFLTNAARQLTPGGTLALTVGGHGNADGLLRHLNGMIASPRWKMWFEGFTSPFVFPTAGDYRLWLGDHGFLARRVELVPTELIHEGRAGMGAWLRSSWRPYLKRLPQMEREIFVGQWLDRYLAEHNVGKDGKARVAMVHLEVDATRMAPPARPA
jgi:trans-aconitate 2-methyltransferase